MQTMRERIAEIEDQDELEDLQSAIEDRLVALGVQACLETPGYYQAGDRVQHKRSGAKATVEAVSGGGKLFLLEWDNGGRGSCRVADFDPLPRL